VSVYPKKKKTKLDEEAILFRIPRNFAPFRKNNFLAYEYTPGKRLLVYSGDSHFIIGIRN